MALLLSERYELGIDLGQSSEVAMYGLQISPDNLNNFSV